MNAEHIAMNKKYNETLRVIADALNYLENEFYVNISLNVGTTQINPSIDDGLNHMKMIEFNGDEWVTNELRID